MRRHRRQRKRRKPAMRRISPRWRIRRTNRIKNLHIHMDERMTSYNYGFGQETSHAAVPDGGEHGLELPEDDSDDIDFEAMSEAIRKETGLCETVILTVLLAQMHYLDTVFGEEEGKV